MGAEPSPDDGGSDAFWWFLIAATIVLFALAIAIVTGQS